MFNPTFDTRLNIDGHEYRFSPHPAVPTLVWGQEGRRAIVYQIHNSGEPYALKVFRPAHRHPGLIDTANGLWAYRELPGMRVCRQTVLTRETHPDLVAEFEDLDYAILMPWINGMTWFDLLQENKRLTLDQSRTLAESIAWVLYALELNHMAHCDLSSGNVIIDPDLHQVHLIDVEDLYSPWLKPPPLVPAGSIGYQHRDVRESGQWGPLGDRFAGAVLMAEMLGWAHPEVRSRAWGESYFSPDELQRDDNERYWLLRDVLWVYDPGFAETFEAAWRASVLESCPPIKTWYDLLDALPRDPVASWAPIDPAEFEEPAPEPTEPHQEPQTVRVAPPVDAPSSQSTQRTASQSQPRKRQGCRRGCRTPVTIVMVLGLLACCALAMVVEWSALANVF